MTYDEAASHAKTIASHAVREVLAFDGEEAARLIYECINRVILGLPDPDKEPPSKVSTGIEN